MIDVIEEALPRQVYPTVYTLFTKIHPERDSISYSKTDDCYLAQNLRTGESIYVHDAKYLYRVQSESADSFRERLESKYTLNGFAEVLDGDVVLDCGSHVGGFSLAVADRATQVFAVEPDPRLQDALSRTLADTENVSLHDIALSDESGSIEFLLSTNPSENSIINVDSGEENERININTLTIDDFVDSTEYEDIDFLKIDAEGAEPEVLQGLGNLRPRAVAVDTGPERNNTRTTNEIITILEDFNYETDVREDIVFGRHLT